MVMILELQPQVARVLLPDRSRADRKQKGICVFSDLLHRLRATYDFRHALVPTAPKKNEP